MSADADRVRGIMSMFYDNPNSLKTKLISVAKEITSHYDCFRTLLMHAPDIRDGLLASLYSDEAKLDIVSKGLGISKESINLAPRKDVVLSLAVNGKYCEALDVAHKTMSVYRSISLEEVVLSWLIIASSHMMIELLGSSSCDQTMLEENVQNAISQAKIGGDFTLAAVEEIVKKDKQSRGEDVEEEQEDY